MTEINLPTASKQDLIKATVENIKTTVDKINASSVIKSIQRGSQNIKANATIKISDVVVEKSIVLIYGGATNGNTGNALPYVSDFRTNQFTVYQPFLNDITISWQVIEFY